ncbi:asparagine synthase (glutamine-hydrolyzing) [Mangrovivirga cuniculi]|uniref:asparagine synthase (glutamine-hydrolyzing) n=1 Tax=Mangrovivirga cuniculi TaxID=2715131 RepID=A0A4D7JGA1_9BACT|nr:asparagine synthase (glutamine-hydrolyzing) [Mangrovivirga cuniculi]
MCGINLIIDKKELLSDLVAIKTMVSDNMHRGPDHRSSLRIRNRETQYFFGANRLKIRDKSENSNQPFIDQQEENVLLFNGEIYNYAELKNELISKGYTFITSSDTEVIFYLLKEEGELGLGRLKGMYSIVFFDRKNDTVLLARDKHGIKPLFYSADKNFIVASSETGPIFSSGLIKKELDVDQLDILLRYKHSFLNETIYRNVFSVSPGSYLKIENGSISKEEFIIERAEENKFELSSNGIEQLIVDSLYRQLSDSVPYGLFLSGGLDSSLLLALNKKHEINYIQTFSLIDKNLAGKGLNDNRLSRLAAKLYGYEHHEIGFDSEPDEQDIYKFIGDLDLPVLDSGAYMNYVLSREASKSVKVVLSGAGADEYWYGYPRYQVYRQQLKNPFSVKALKLILRLARTSGFSKVDAVTDRRFKRYVDSVDKTSEKSWNNLLQVPLLNQSDFPEEIADFINKNEKNLTPQLWDQKNYLVNDVLLQSDLMTMAHGLEMRVPYLDDELVMAAGELQKSLFEGGKSKSVLKEIFSKIDGSGPFIRRSKEGMGLPFYSWIDSRFFSDRIEKIFNDNNSIISETESFKYIKKQKGYRKQLADQANAAATWNFVALDLWLEQNGFK